MAGFSVVDVNSEHCMPYPSLRGNESIFMDKSFSSRLGEPEMSNAWPEGRSFLSVAAPASRQDWGGSLACQHTF